MVGMIVWIEKSDQHLHGFGMGYGVNMAYFYDTPGWILAQGGLIW